MKIYTKTGDQGETGLFAGPRVRKDHPRIEAYGSVDELNSLLGVVRAEPLPEAMNLALTRVQNDLFVVGAQLATPDPAAHRGESIDSDHVIYLEKTIDEHEADLAPLKEFILPAGTRAASVLQLARSVCRRAERRVIQLESLADEEVSSTVIAYLNRLADLLFVFSRSANAAAGVGDVPWSKTPPR